MVSADTSADDGQFVLRERHQRAMVLTLNRPEKGNLLNFAMLTSLREALAAADADEAVDAIVLTGAGSAFCVGDDGADILSADPAVARQINEAIFRSPYVWPPTSKPVIGAINGATERGGMEVAMQCDFLIASEKATFRDAHVIDGVVPAWALTATLPAAVSRGTAIRMMLTCRPLDAEQALIAGLVTQVVAHDALLAQALEVVADIARCDQPAVRSALATVRAGGPLGDDRLLDLEFEAHRRLLEDHDRFPGVREVLRTVAAERGRHGD
jgi:enoyl-CoA hydratase